MEGHSVIATDVLAKYAADAACDTPGVRGLVEGALHRHKGVKISHENDRVNVELHLAVEWGASIPEVGANVQHRVADYLGRMADVTPGVIDVVVDDVA